MADGGKMCQNTVVTQIGKKISPGCRARKGEAISLLSLLRRDFAREEIFKLRHYQEYRITSE